MREIKFRMWNSHKKGYHYDSSTVLTCLQQEISGTYSHVNNHGDCFEQFTGLKDKNGKEIFKGDVVDVMNIGPGTIVFGNYPLFDEAWGEECRTPCFCIAWADGSGYSEMLSKGLEVIGNIHESHAPNA